MTTARTRHERAPAVLLALAVLAMVAVAALVVRVNIWALDETVIKQSAVHYTSGLPSSLFHDLNARGTSRAYSLLISPLFRAFDGYKAIQLAHLLNVLLWFSTFLPVWLIARRLGASRVLSSVAGALAVTIPWLAIASVLYTENLAYPVFVWAAWAALMALWQPAPWRDALALILIGLALVSRTQLAPLLGAYWLCVIVVCLSRPDRLVFARRVTRLYPLSAAAFVIGVLFFVKLVLGGGLHARVQTFLGSYSEIQDRTTVPNDFVRGLLVEVLAIGVGVGILPGAIALDWVRQLFTRGTREVEKRIFAGYAIAASLAIALPTLYAQSGFRGPDTEERYYMYAAPFALIACVVAIQERSIRPRAVAVWLGALALLVATVGLPTQPTTEHVFLAPVDSVANHTASKLASATGWAGLTNGDVLFWCVVVVGVGWLVAWRLLPRARVWATLVIPAALQLGMTATAFAIIDGKVAGIEGRTGSGDGLSWIDARVGSGHVAWLNSQLRPPDASADFVQRQTLYFNDQITDVLYDPERPLPFVNFPMSALPLAPTATGPGAGPLPPYAVQQADSPFEQIDGPRVERGPIGNLELIRTPQPLALKWRLVGPGPDGALATGASATWSAMPTRSELVTLNAAKPAVVDIRANGAPASRFRLSGSRVVSISGCRGGALTTVRGVITLTSVRVTPAASDRCTVR